MAPVKLPPDLERFYKSVRPISAEDRKRLAAAAKKVFKGRESLLRRLAR